MVELARSLDLGKQRVSFPAAVSVEQLVPAARADGDVGLVPYTPAGANYTNCSPNKLSQYMAAGLPVLANATNFVTEVVQAAGGGIVVDFQREAALKDAIARLCDDIFRQNCADRSLAFFDCSYHWEAVSAPLYAAMTSSVSKSDGAALRFFAERQKPVEPKSDSVHQPSPRSFDYRMARRLWRLLPFSAKAQIRKTILRLNLLMEDNARP
jgi:hypothetical protein